MGQVRLEDARRVIAAAEKKAAEIGQPMILQWQTRAATLSLMSAWTCMDRSIDISRRRPIPRAPLISRPRIWQRTRSRVVSSSVFMLPTTGDHDFAGGIPLKKDGKGRCAIGVSGGSGDQDTPWLQQAPQLSNSAAKGIRRSGDAGDETGAPAPAILEHF